MENAFSRVVAIFVGVACLFLVPLAINLQRQESMIQLAIMQDTVQFTDAVRNMGTMTKDMYNEYQNQIRHLQDGLEIYMEHTCQNIVVSEGKVQRIQIKNTQKDVLEALEGQGFYSMQKGDYFRGEGRKKVGVLERFLCESLGMDSMHTTTYVYYGGSVRYET